MKSNAYGDSYKSIKCMTMRNRLSCREIKAPVKVMTLAADSFMTHDDALKEAGIKWDASTSKLSGLSSTPKLAGRRNAKIEKSFMMNRSACQ